MQTKNRINKIEYIIIQYYPKCVGIILNVVIVVKELRVPHAVIALIYVHAVLRIVNPMIIAANADTIYVKNVIMKPIYAEIVKNWLEIILIGINVVNQK